ncbi:MAG TPA: hypothetical protein VFF59_03340 [Anaerolineae bacterium]|nr:hypothetical protein [Anaerolineae bacterium]
MTKQTQPSRLQQIKMFISIGKSLAASYVGWTIIISLVVGLLIGWFLLGWVIAPVVYTDARPASLSQQYQEIHLGYAASAYAANQVTLDTLAAQLGEGWTKQQVLDRLDQMIKAQRPGTDRLTKLRSDLNARPGPIGPTQVVAPSNALVPILIALLVVIVGGLLLARRMRPEPPQARLPPSGIAPIDGAPVDLAEAGPVVVAPVSYAAGGARPVEKSDWSGEERPPLSQYQTVYAIGDDRYDMSFSIENEAGDFLGECGVGISETIGTGSPSKVTALEVWLFDKNDIRTVTKVLMTEHCYNDAALRTKLAPKGEAVLVHAGEVVPLSTQTLKINARVDNVVYGDASHSYFQQVTIQIGAWSLTI